MSSPELGCWPPPRLVREIRAVLGAYLRRHGRDVSPEVADVLVDFGVYLFSPQWRRSLSRDLP